jgi:hypothetical protein
MRIVERTELPKDYHDMMVLESHHDHAIIEDDNGVYRWEENTSLRDFLDGKVNLNDVVVLLRILGYDKNSEVYRKCYRDLGYSLSGYYDIFHWEMNNPDVDDYVPHVLVPVCKKKNS